jgi:hypothetical protein
LALIAGAIAVGSLVQGSLGFGMVLIAGPLVTLIEPRAVPGMFLLLGFPLVSWVLIRDRAALDVPGFGQMMAGRALGTVAAFGVLVVVSRQALTAMIGAAIVIAALLSWRLVEWRSGTFGRIVAGGISGLMATVAAVGGPAMALAYRDREPPELRATLAATFLVGGVLSVIALAASDLLHWWHARLSLLMLPAELLGVAVSGLVLGRIRAETLRKAVLALAAGGGAVVMLKALI